MATQPRLTTTQRGYNARHTRSKDAWGRLVDRGGVICRRCGEGIAPGEPWDLGHDDNDRSLPTHPEHRACNRSTRSRLWQPVNQVLEPEREGLPPTDARWAVPWLDEFRDVPADATWPRFMTVPHPRAVGSLGPEFVAWAEERSGRKLRWWQRLVATRLLEIDADGKLVWETLVLSTARQLGKSWLLRELMLWRVHQGERFGEPQDVMHTGKDLAICKEVQRPARLWAKAQPARFKVTEVNGQEEIQLKSDGSRWMLRAKSAVQGYSVGLAVVDEAWKVKPTTIDDDLTPTMVEREQPQLLLTSTAHRLATVLMLRRRLTALEGLEVGDGDLILEWSAPPEARLDDIDGWRQASPYWTPRRQRLVAKQLEALASGEIVDPEEPDPEASFRCQWLNQWPQRLVQRDKNEPLLPGGLWFGLAEEGVESFGQVYVAVEDDYGRGAGIAAVARLEDGRLEVDGWSCDDWDSAIDWVRRLGLYREIRELHIGASMIDRVPEDLPTPIPAVNSQASAGMAVFRDLAASRSLVHDTTEELDRALAETLVRESPSGLQIAQGPRHLVKAVAWAILAAHKPAKVYAVR